MNDFEVVVMTNAPLPHIKFFCEQYRRYGAVKVSVYYDSSDTCTLEKKDCNLVVCDQEFWASINQDRPLFVEERQRKIYQFAYERATTTWILFVDIDEFIFSPTGLSSILDRCPSHVFAIRFPTVEAVFTSSQKDLNNDFSALIFRRPYNKYISYFLPYILYPGIGGLFVRGILGHAIGKQIFKSKIAGLQIQIHHAEIGNNALKSYTPKDLFGGEQVYLYHFNAVSFEDWKKKWLRRLKQADTKEMGKKGDRQLDLFRKYHEKSDDKLLFRKMYVLNYLQIYIMRLFNQIVDRPSDM